MARPRDRKLRADLRRQNEQLARAAKESASTDALLVEQAGFLQPETEMDKTFKVTQDEILASVDTSMRKKRISLKLPQLGPYGCRYSSTGNHALLAGMKGHVASFNWKTGEQNCELHLGETVHDATFLQNDQEYFAVAQKKYVYIYDGKSGSEIHQLKNHIEATKLDYLPYHYLLVSAGNTGFIKYHDVSTGQLVSELRSKLGPTRSLCHNPWNAVVHTGHANGTVTLWAPSMPEPLVKLQSARGPVQALSVDRTGNYMAAAGLDRSVKIWDIRNFKVLESYYSPRPASSVNISQTGLLAVGWGSHVQIWKDVLTRTGPKVSAPYMNFPLPGEEVRKVAFCPFEDVLGIGHSSGFDSIIAPGAGEANIDALEINPYSYASRTTRRETQVKHLLEKLQPDMIALDPGHIGEVDRRSRSERLSAAQVEEAKKAEAAAAEAKMNPRKVSGKNSAVRRLLRKKAKNVMDERKLHIQKALELEKKARQRSHRAINGMEQEKEEGAALRRFHKR